jgi:hypothetical protein
MRGNIVALVFSGAIACAIFNFLAPNILEVNASLRAFVITGRFSSVDFEYNGLPTLRSARVGDYRSPFYVVHYGLQYSEACRARVAAQNTYHWSQDPTRKHWHASPLSPTIERFRVSVEWLIDKVKRDVRGNAHIYYDFDWPYPNHPGGWLRAPWYSGLTEAHAITLFLRAYDCFGDKRYEKVAGELYRSVVRPLTEGGSLGQLNGGLWIEEYVDRSVDPESLSQVFNGAVYSYFGVEAYERYANAPVFGSSLLKSISSNYRVFDDGFWSFYDTVGSKANLKYHRVNLALLTDPRLQGVQVTPTVLQRWTVGATVPVLFYGINGPSGVAKWHFYVSLLMVWAGLFCIIAIGFHRYWQFKTGASKLARSLNSYLS